MDTKTRRFDVSPCVMLVALPDLLAQTCMDALKPLTATKPVQVMRVAHVRAACERMLVTRPMIVVYSDALADADGKVLSERAEDISAIVVVLPRAVVKEMVAESLFVALRDASARNEY